MKTNLKRFFFSLGILYGLSGQAQSISVTYTKKIINPDPTASNFETNWILETDNNISLYRPIGKISDTAWVKEFEVMGETHKAPSTHYMNYEIYYVDVKSNEKITVHHFAGKDYLVKESLEIMEWEIKDKTKKIDTYNCRLAISEKDGYPVEAWFTEDIFVSANPNGFNGLPGLILEYRLALSHLFVEEIVFDNNVKINPPDWGSNISKEDYNKIVAETFSFPVGITFIDTKNDDGTITTRIIEVTETKPKKAQE